jgi:hypothetical protein
MDAITCRALVASNGVMYVNDHGTHCTIAASIDLEEMPTVVVRLVVVHAPFREYSNCVSALHWRLWLGLVWSGLVLKAAARQSVTRVCVNQRIEFDLIAVYCTGACVLQ